ncbi:MAG: hypothetical protein WBD87_07260 [Candidatus Acidiferrales bacterium]
MSRPFFAFAHVGALSSSAGVTIAPHVTAVMTKVTIHGIALTEIPADTSPNHARTEAVAAEFTIRAAQLPEVAANIAIHATAHASVVPDVAAVVSNLAMHAISRSGAGRLSQAANGK